MAARPLFWIAGTLTGSGRRFSDSRGTAFHHLEIRELGGKVRRVTMVHAVDEVAALVEEDAAGTFFFWALPGERRLWCVAREEGPRNIDLQTMQRIIAPAD